MPCSEMNPGRGWVMEKSTAVSPFLESLGRMPESAHARLNNDKESREELHAQSGANPSDLTPGKNFLTSSIANSILSSVTAILVSQKSGTSSPSSSKGGESHSTSGPKRISPSMLRVR